MPRPPAIERLKRLLAMIPWVLAHEQVAVDDIARHFGISTAQVTADIELAAMIGIPPYLGDCLVDMYIDDDTVWARAGEFFTRPPRLSVAEGFAVLAAGRALLAVPGAGGAGSALESAMAKLEKVLGTQGGLAVDVHTPPMLIAVGRAADEGRQLEVDYWSAYRDELTTRAIEPAVVFERKGRWYVSAFSPETGDSRHYRIDRIRRLAETGQRFEPAPTAPPTEVFDRPVDAVAVTIEAPTADARWVVESYPCEVAELGDRVRITLHVVGHVWLERLLLRLGPDARVVAPASLADAQGDAARRVLAAYAADSPEAVAAVDAGA